MPNQDRPEVAQRQKSAADAALASLRKHGVKPGRLTFAEVSAHTVILFPEIGLALKATTDFGSHLEREALILGLIAESPAPRLAFSNHVERVGDWTLLWLQLLDVSGEFEDSKAVAALEEVHQALKKVPVASVETWQEIYDRSQDVLETLPDESLRSELRAACRRFVEPLLAEPAINQVIHGDAHLNNVLPTPSGPVWIDYESVRVGPVEYDLAMLEDPTGYRHFDAELRMRFYRARAAENTIWAFDAAARDARWLPRAERCLAEIRSF